MREFTPDSSGEFENLICQVGEGSLEATETIFEKYSGSLLRAVRRRLPKAIRPKIDSTDIFQSIWASVLAHPTRLSEMDSPERLVAYLTGVAHLKVLEKYRHYTQAKAYDVRREQRMSDPADPLDPHGVAGLDRTMKKAVVKPKAFVTDQRIPSPSAVAEAREVWGKLVSICNDQDRAVIELRISGKTQDEIAKELNVSSRTVRRCLQRLLEAVS